MLFFNALFIWAVDPVHQILQDQVHIMIARSSAFVESDLSRHFSTMYPQTVSVAPPGAVTALPVVTTEAESRAAFSKIESFALGGTCEAIKILNEICKKQPVLLGRRAIGELKNIEKLALGGHVEAIQYLSHICSRDSISLSPYSDAFVKFHGQWSSAKADALKALLACGLEMKEMQQILDLIIEQMGLKREVDTAYSETVKEMWEKRQDVIWNAQKKKVYRFLSVFMPLFTAVCFPITFGLSFLPQTSTCMGIMDRKLTLIGSHMEHVSLMNCSNNTFNMSHNFGVIGQMYEKQNLSCTQDGYAWTPLIAMLAGVVSALLPLLTSQETAKDWSLMKSKAEYKKYFAVSDILITIKLGITMREIAGRIVPDPDTSASLFLPLEFQFDSENFGQLTDGDTDQKRFLKYLNDELQEQLL